MPGFKGGCLCGAVTYEVSSDPVNMWNCHCDDCRKVTGASFATNVFVKLENVTITKGKTSTYESAADSGNIMTKEFCSNCGSQLFNSSSARPAIRVVRAGSIDDASFVKPWANCYSSKALSCTHLADELDNFEMGPDAATLAERLSS
jgi:hypothetical protein